MVSGMLLPVRGSQSLTELGAFLETKHSPAANGKAPSETRAWSLESSSKGKRRSRDYSG